MRVKKTMQAMVIVILMAFAPVSAGTHDDAALRGDGFRASAADHALAGSWLVTYDVPAFGPPFPLLLSFADGGVAIETDAPGSFRSGRVSRSF